MHLIAHWLYSNINHFTAPLGTVLALFSAMVGTFRRRRRKNGQPDIAFSPLFKTVGWLILCACCVLLGVAIVRNFA